MLDLELPVLDLTYKTASLDDSVQTEESPTRVRVTLAAAALRTALGGSAPRAGTTGHGEADPVAPNTRSDGSDNPRGRARNRRVTIAFDR